MRPTDILDKTQKGQEEIRTRKYKLGGKARMLLLLVDGQHPAFVLREQAQKMSLPEDTLDALVAEGYVEARRGVSGSAPAADASAVASATNQASGERPADNERFTQFTAARRLMTESIFSALGLKGFLFSLKIEKTSNLDDVRALIPEYERVMIKALSEEGASLFVKRLRELTGS
jgi:hypothetical protein